MPSNWQILIAKTCCQTFFLIARAVILLHMCTINEDNMLYGSWDIRHDKQSFLSFWVIFALQPSKQPEKSKFWKNEKNAWKYCILHLHTTNDDHRMYCSWDMEPDRQNFLSFWTIFCPFTHLTTHKIKILKK